MLVDDEELSRFAMRTLLMRNFSDVSVVAEAETGEEAIELYERHRPDGVIMDLRIPGMDGLKVSRYIMERYPMASILICSAYDSFSLISEALEIGVKGYLLKPIKRDEAVEKIQKLFELSLSKVELFADQQLLNLLLLAPPQPDTMKQIERAYGDVNQGILMAMHAANPDEDRCRQFAYALKKRVNACERVFAGIVSGHYAAIAVPGDSLQLWRQRFSEAILEADLGRDDTTVAEIRHGGWHRAWTDIEHRFSLKSLGESGLSQLNNIDRFVQDEMLADFSLDRLASDLNVTPQHLSAMFKERVGVNFIEYVTRRRMQYAGRLLRENRMSTSEIASACGYADPAYFRRLFVRTYGMTPHEYRERGSEAK